MGMTHLVVSFSNHWPLTLANELEYVTQKLNAGENVHVLSCNGGLEYCRYKVYDDDRTVCDCCIHRRTAVYRHFLSNPRFKLLPLQIESIDPTAKAWTTTDVEQLVVDGIPIGTGCLSSLIYEHRNIDFDAELPAKISRYIATATQVVLSTKKFLSNAHSYDVALLFNGRFCEEYTARQVFMQHNISYVTHENTSSGLVQFFFNETPQMIGAWQKKIKLYNEKVQIDSKLGQIGHEFFQKRKNGAFTNDTVYITSDYMPFKMPDLAFGRRIISIFNSSEDEIRFTDFAYQYSNSFISTQYEGIKLIVDKYRNDVSTIVIIRIHPNLATGNPNEVKNIESLEGNNIFVISPNDKISSYSVLENSHVVVSMLSTIGIESTYWGVPSISLLPCAYTVIDGTHLVESAEQLFKLIEDPNLKSKDKSAAIAYGAMMMSDGDIFEHVAGQFPELYFKGERLLDFGTFRLESKWYVLLCRYGMSFALAQLFTRPLRILGKVKMFFRG